jgi:hypothetical protein
MSREFREIAAEYCAWVEGRETREDVALWLAGILGELIHAVYKIPDDGFADAGAEEGDGYKARAYQDVRIHYLSYLFSFTARCMRRLTWRAMNPRSAS